MDVGGVLVGDKEHGDGDPWRTVLVGLDAIRANTGRAICRRGDEDRQINDR